MVWSYFSQKMRVMAIKFLELTQFASPILSIYLILNGVVERYDSDIFKLTALAQSVYREVSGISN